MGIFVLTGGKQRNMHFESNGKHEIRNRSRRRIEGIKKGCRGGGMEKHMVDIKRIHDMSRAIGKFFTDHKIRGRGIYCRDEHSTA